MAREDLHFRLRIPEDLKLRIEKAAEQNRRSMTAEMVERLEQSFYWPQRQLDDDLKARIDTTSPSKRSSRDLRLVQRLAELYPAENASLVELLAKVEAALRDIPDEAARQAALDKISKMKPTIAIVERADELGLEFEPGQNTIYVPKDDEE